MNNQNKHFLHLLVLLIIMTSSALFADEDIYGKYVIENAVDDYQGARYFEIKRNPYQEYEVIADNSFDSVAYYDCEE